MEIHIIIMDGQFWQFQSAEIARPIARYLKEII